MQWITCPNWGEFQHYKDRDPPWIKLHRKILDNWDWGCLPDASKAHLMGIWLLLARHNNRIPGDPVWIGKRLSATEHVDLQVLVDAGLLAFVDDAGNALAPRQQKPMLETEAETETEVTDAGRETAPAASLQHNFRATWTPAQREAADGWRRALPDPRAFDAIVAQAAEERLVGGGFGWPVVGQALLEMRGASGVTFGLACLLGFCRRIRDRGPTAEPVTNVADEFGRMRPARRDGAVWRFTDALGGSVAVAS